MNYTNWKNLPDKSTPLTAENLLNDINKTKEEINNLEQKIKVLEEETKIIESNSTENGEYIKYSDGRMICYQTIKGTIEVTNAWGTLYSTSAINSPDFPVEFIEIPYIFMTQHDGQAIISQIAPPTSKNPGNIVLLRGNSSPSVNYKIDIFSIGKWK